MEVMNSGTVGGHITNITFSAGSWAAILHSPFHAMAYLHIFKNISIFYTHHLAICVPLFPSQRVLYFHGPLIKNDNFCIYSSPTLALQMF